MYKFKTSVLYYLNMPHTSGLRVLMNAVSIKTNTVKTSLKDHLIIKTTIQRSVC